MVRKVSSVMTRNLITLRADASLQKAVEVMSTANIGSVLILAEDNSIAGVLSERDILRYLKNNEATSLSKNPISLIMTTTVVTITENDSVGLAEELMRKGNFRHVPVVNAKGEVSGIVSSKDVFHSFHNDQIKKIEELETVQKIAKTVCHEIDNPLTVLKSCSQSLKKKMNEKKIDGILDAVDRISKVTQSLRELDSLEDIEYSKSSTLFKIRKDDAKKVS